MLLSICLSVYLQLLFSICSLATPPSPTPTPLTFCLPLFVIVLLTSDPFIPPIFAPWLSLSPALLCSRSGSPLFSSVSVSEFSPKKINKSAEPSVFAESCKQRAKRALLWRSVEIYWLMNCGWGCSTGLWDCSIKKIWKWRWRGTFQKDDGRQICRVKQHFTVLSGPK